MADGNEQITLPGFAKRLAAKLMEPGAMSAFRTAMLVKRDAPMSIGLLLEQRAAESSRLPAIKYRQQTLTWSQFNDQVNRCAHYFVSRDIAKQDVIAVNMNNRPEVLVVACAASKLGAITAMINTGQSGDVLAHSLRLVKPKLFVVGEEQVSSMSSVSVPLESELTGRLLYVTDAASTTVPGGYAALADEIARFPSENPDSTTRIRLSDACFYIFTSGTTGLPKASIMSHYRWYRTAVSMGLLTMSMKLDDTFYCCLPFYHNNALTVSFGSVLASGASIAISPKFSASRFWDEIREYEATCFCYIGEILRYLVNQPPRGNDREHKIRAIVGNGLRPDIWDQFKTRFGIERIHEFYAASEGTNGFFNVLNYDKTCGFAPSGWEIVEYDIAADEPVRKANGRMKKLGRGQTGLLLTEVSEKMPFDGYTNKDATEKKLFRDVFKKGDCWFNTGDLIKSLGYGHAQFVDRVGDTFRWQGENVATTEVERIANAWSQLEDAVVYGVSVPGRDGRCGMLSCSLKNGAVLDASGFAAHLRDALPRYAVPRFLRIRKEQDLTGTFKHQKSGLKADGYDPTRISDRLFLLEPGSESWQPLSAGLVQKINEGIIKL